MIAYARCDSHFLIPIYAQIQAMLAQLPFPASQANEESKEPHAASLPHFMNTLACPLQAFKEVSASGSATSGGMFFSEELANEEWFAELRRLSHKRTLAFFSQAQPEGMNDDSTTEQRNFSGLTDLAIVTNKYLTHKMTKNNYRKVFVQF